jgi:RNA polymerase sigma factor (sigma-70 family)
MRDAEDGIMGVQLSSDLLPNQPLVCAPGGPDLSDRELLESFSRTRQESAFAVLVRRHGPLVWGVCRRVLLQAQDAEDVFQATFLVLARKASTVRWQEGVASWLYQVAFRLACKSRTEARRRRVREHTAATTRTEPPVVDAVVGIRQVLDEELARLPRAYRAPLVLCYLEGKSRDEAARELGWTVGRVKGGLERGRALLRARLTPHGITVPATLFAATVGQAKVVGAIPTGLTDVVTKAAPAFASVNGAETAGVSHRVAALTQSYLQRPWLALLKKATPALLGLGLAGASADAIIYQQPNLKTWFNPAEHSGPDDNTQRTRQKNHISTSPRGRGHDERPIGNRLKYEPTSEANK